MFIKEDNEKSQIIKLIKQSRTDDELKSMLIDLVNLLVVDNIDISDLKDALRKTLSSNGTKLNSVLDVIEDTQDDRVLIKANKVLNANDDLLDKLENKEIKVQPRTKEELKQIIKDTIKEKGNKCDLNFIDTSLITDMSGLFDSSDFNGDISKWDVSNVKNMSEMFDGSKFNGDISNWDVSNVEDMAYMFCVSNFNTDISKWDVSNVKDMSKMFYDSKFNRDISKWNVSNVKDMSEMFEYSKFNRDISKWNVSNVKDMSGIFYSSDFNGDISKWDVSNVKNLSGMYEMFDNSPLEDKPEYQPKFEN